MTLRPAPFKNDGFTLLEAIIYVALFALMFTGIFVSVQPLFTGIERLNRGILVEGEVAFIQAKIRYLLANSITSDAGVVVAPAIGDTSDLLAIEVDGVERYRLEQDNSGANCSPPLNCQMLTLAIAGGPALPLNAERVYLENFSVFQSDTIPRYLEISFTANDKPIGPTRYYLHF